MLMDSEPSVMDQECLGDSLIKELTLCSSSKGGQCLHEKEKHFLFSL